MNPTPTIFDFLDVVRQRPEMYAGSIKELESQVHGYYAALDLHHIQENVPSMTDKFSIWLRETTGWSTCSGWGYAFDRRTAVDQDVFQHFFTYVNRYRELKPTVTARVTLRPEHQPTGKRCKIGMDGRMERPDEILAVNYAPTSLNHLRYRYGDHCVDGWFLYVDGSHQTQQADLLAWVADEFNVDPSDWELIAGEHVIQTDLESE